MQQLTDNSVVTVLKHILQHKNIYYPFIEHCVNEFSVKLADKDFFLICTKFSNLFSYCLLVLCHVNFAMHRLKSWSMSGERLCGPALLYIY